MKKGRIFFQSVMVAVLCLILQSVVVAAVSFKTIAAPREGNYRGLTWDSRDLWVADNASRKLYRLDPESGSVSRILPAPPGSYMQGLTFDGYSLWHSQYDGVIYQLDAYTGNTMKSIMGPTETPTDLAWDGSSLWTASYIDNTIYQFSPVDGSVISSFASFGNTPWGITFDGTNLWYSENDFVNFQRYVYQLDPESGEVLYSFKIPEESHYTGLTFDGENLWSVDLRSNTIEMLIPEPGMMALVLAGAVGIRKYLYCNEI